MTFRRRLTSKQREPLSASAQPTERDAKDYAIEFGEYLAKDVQAFLDFLNKVGAGAHIKDQDELTDHWRGLQSAIYEFRKRAARAGVA